MWYESKPPRTDEKPERTPYTGRFLQSRRGGWIATPTCDLARYLGGTESNLIISMQKARAGKPDADLLYCEAPADLTGARRSRGARKTLLVSRAMIRWYPTAARVDKRAMKAVEDAFAAEYRRRRAERKAGDQPDADAHEEPDGPVVAPEACVEEERVGPPAPPVVFNRDGQALTTSLAVAAAYGKLHQHVMRDIRGILETGPKLDASFVFKKTTYPGHNGESRPMYEMNEQAFTLVALAFTGAEAFRLRVAYIVEFKRMQRALADQSPYEDASDDAKVLMGYQVLMQRTAALEETVMRRDNEIAILQPKAISNDRLAKSYGLLNITETAKMLQTDRKYFVQFLLATKQSYRSGSTNEADGDLTGHAEHCESGTARLTHRPFTFQNKHGETITKSQMLITPKGLSVYGHQFRLWYVRTYPFNAPPPPLQPDMLNPRPN